MDMLKNLINFMLSILKIIMEIFFRVNKFKNHKYKEIIYHKLIINKSHKNNN